MMRKVEGYELKLSALLRENQQTPFAWGSHDCLMWCAKVVKELTGQDVGASAPSYSTEEEALAALAARGGLEAVITESLGCEPHSNIHKARRGDVVIVKNEAGPLCGVVDDSGRRVAAVSAADGLIRLDKADILLVWSY